MNTKLIKDNIIYVDFENEEFSLETLEDPTSFFETEYAQKINILETNIDDYFSAVEKNNNSNEELISQIFGVLTSQVLGPLGIGADIFKDQKGGNVTTTHNAKQKIYAHDYEDYHRDEYVTNEYVKTRDKLIAENKAANNGNIVSDYTGKIINGSPDADHLNSTSEFNSEGGFRATKEQKSKFGSDERNLNLVESGLNRSKGEENIDDWMNKTSTDGEQTNKEKYGINEDLVKQRQQDANEAKKEHMPTKMQAAIYDTKMMAKEGAKTGVKSAIRQAVLQIIGKFIEGVIKIIKEAIATFKETKDDGFKAFFNELKVRIIKFKEDFLNSAETKNFLLELAKGAAASFSGSILSTIITYIINTFLTTVAKTVTIIREAIDAVSKTIQIMCDKTKSIEERVEAATKILVGALFAVLGVVLVEFLASQLKTIPLFSEIGEDLANIIVNIIIGILSVLVIHLVISYIKKQGIIKKAQIAAYSATEISLLETAQTAKMVLEVHEYQNQVGDAFDKLFEKENKDTDDYINELKSLGIS